MKELSGALAEVVGGAHVLTDPQMRRSYEVDWTGRFGAPAALVVEHHHPFRATRMLGLCLRGRLVLDPAARAGIAERYGGALPEGGTAVRLEPARLTWWRGFQVRTRAVERAAAVAPAR